MTRPATGNSVTIGETERDLLKRRSASSSARGGEEDVRRT